MSARALRIFASSYILFSVVIWCSSTASAQTEAATVRGRVADSSGAMVPSATVRLIDIDRGRGSQAISDNSGFYSFANVRPGHYRMQVQKDGFRIIHLTNLTVNVQDNLEENF